MAEPLRHRQTKEAATDMFDLQPPRHISTLPLTLFARVHVMSAYTPIATSETDITNKTAVTFAAFQY